MTANMSAYLFLVLIILFFKLINFFILFPIFFIIILIIFFIAKAPTLLDARDCKILVLTLCKCHDSSGCILGL